MSLFMKDPKKTAMLILDSAMKKKSQTSDGAYKDASLANDDQASKLLAALSGKDKEALVSVLRSFVQDVMNESTDEKPEVEEVEV